VILESEPLNIMITKQKCGPLVHIKTQTLNMMKKLFTLLVLLAQTVYGQNCDCTKQLENLITKVKYDYPGFSDKVNDLTRSAYDMLEKEMYDNASQTFSFHRCSLILDQYLDYFHDAHLHLSIETNRYWAYKKVTDSTIMIRIPSFSFSSKDIIDSLITTNINELTSIPNLIIDLRGNGGGIDYSFLKLLPLVYSHPYVSDAVEWYASEGNLKSFEDALRNGKIRKGSEEWTKKLIKLMNEHRGEFVVLDPPDTVKRDTVYPNPRNVGIIIDDYCGSSCEQFILDAKHSAKVILFGCQTYGVLDYSNTSPEPLGIEGLNVYIPKTRSTRLPENPIDNIGIKPDIEINLPYNLNVRDNVDDWVLFVKDYLENF